MIERIYQIPIGDLKEEVAKRQNKINRRNSLHYCAPSGGGWGVVRVACMVPEVLVLFVIPIGCGRHGGIAAFNTKDNHKVRYLLVEEVEIVMGSYLERIPKTIEVLVEEEKPKGLILFSTCMDDLLGADYDSIIKSASKKLNIPIIRGKMNPIMSDTKKAPELMIQNTIYSFLKVDCKDEKQLNVIGSLSNIDEESEIHQLLKEAEGLQLNHIADCKTLDEFEKMGNSSMNLLIKPAGINAVKNLEKFHQQPFLEVLSSFNLEEIKKNYQLLSEALKIDLKIKGYEEKTRRFLEESKGALEGKKVAIGATINARSFELARFLTEQGMVVTYIIGKALLKADEIHVQWLKENSPSTKIIPDLDPSLANVSEKIDKVDYCIGIDAAVYFDTTYLIDLPFDETLYGFKAPEKLVQRIKEALPLKEDLYELIYKANLVV